MAVFNAASEGYELCELDGKPVAFTNMRLDRQTVPDALYCYDIRDSDNCDGSCAEVKAHVMVNHWGTILCKSPFPLDEHGSYYPQEDMDYKGISISLQDFQVAGETELLEQQQKSTITMKSVLAASTLTSSSPCLKLSSVAILGKQSVQNTAVPTGMTGRLLIGEPNRGQMDRRRVRSAGKRSAESPGSAAAQKLPCVATETGI